MHLISRWIGFKVNAQIHLEEVAIASSHQTTHRAYVRNYDIAV